MTVPMVQLEIAAHAVEGVPMVMTVTSASRLHSDFCNVIVVSCGLRRGQADAAHGTQPHVGVLGLWHLHGEFALTLLELDQRWGIPPAGSGLWAMRPCSTSCG